MILTTYFVGKMKSIVEANKKLEIRNKEPSTFNFQLSTFNFQPTWQQLFQTVRLNVCATVTGWLS
jgi:hypothetical protein